MSRDKKCRYLLEEIVFTAGAWESETFPDFLTPFHTAAQHESCFFRSFERGAKSPSSIAGCILCVCGKKREFPEQWKSFN